MQVLPQFLCIQIKVDVNGTFLYHRCRFLLEVWRGVIDNVELGLITGRQNFFVLPLLLLCLGHLRGVRTNCDLAGAGVTGLRHLEQLLGKLAETLVVLSQL